MAFRILYSALYRSVDIHDFQQCQDQIQEILFGGVEDNTYVDADLPVTRATCESFDGQLLAVGGEDDSVKPTTAVHTCNSATNSWEIISHMTIGQYIGVGTVGALGGRAPPPNVVEVY